MNEVMDGQMNLFDQDTWFGKTCPERYPATKERTLRQSLKKSSKSQSRKRPIFKCLNTDGLHGGGYRDMGGRWSVAYRIHDAQWYGVPQRRRRISVVADFGGSTAHEILFEPCGLSGNTSESGAQGKRPAGAVETGTSYAVRIRGGCEGGGKGALVQREKSGTLGTGNDQTLFCMNPWDSQSARLYDADGVYSSLNANSGGGQNRAGVFCMATQQGGAEIRSDGKAPTLTAAAGMSGNNQPVVIPINDKATRFKGGGDTRKNDGSGNGLGIGKDGDPAPTITAADKHIVAELKAYGLITKGNGEALLMNEKHCSLCTGGGQLGQGYPAVLQAYSFDSLSSNSMKSKNPNSGCRKVECAKTLDTTCPDPSKNQGGIAILDMSHANDVIRECGEQAPALQARMGTGGNQVPLVAYGIGNGQANEASIMAKEVSQTLNTMHDAQAVMCAYREDAEIYPVQNMVVRRLTPLECTRLQGFPDGWVDIGEWTDEKGRVHKEADAPKYKALGNSIALPFWKWLLRRISEYLPEGATLGSLFDGIGGFPLCWAEIHGAENCRWSSEIEQFPIAVVKRHFGDEDAGISGDLDEFLRGPVVR